MSVYMANFVESVSQSNGQPMITLKAFHQLANLLIEPRLFTILEIDSTGGSRIYSSEPEVYPVFGRKPIPTGHWAEIAIHRKDVFVANDIDAIANVFPDYELIKSLGCESAINLPIIVGGEVIGTVNCLDKAGAYTFEKVTAAKELLLPGVTCMLLYKFLGEQGNQS